jgi:hypothetical protein
MNETTEIEAIRRVEDWPRYPILPMKKRGSLDIGVIVANQVENGGPIKVYGINLFSISSGTIPRPDWPVIGEYTDVEGLVDSGWVGD